MDLKYCLNSCSTSYICMHSLLIVKMGSISGYWVTRVIAAVMEVIFNSWWCAITNSSGYRILYLKKTYKMPDAKYLNWACKKRQNDWIWDTKTHSDITHRWKTVWLSLILIVLCLISCPALSKLWLFGRWPPMPTGVQVTHSNHNASPMTQPHLFTHPNPNCLWRVNPRH